MKQHIGIRENLKSYIGTLNSIFIILLGPCFGLIVAFYIEWRHIGKNAHFPGYGLGIIGITLTVVVIRYLYGKYEKKMIDVQIAQTVSEIKEVVERMEKEIGRIKLQKKDENDQ